MERLKKGELNDRNPVEILSAEREIDLPSYDSLYSRFVKGDWGKDPITNPNLIAKSLSQFIVETDRKKITL